MNRKNTSWGSRETGRGWTERMKEKGGSMRRRGGRWNSINRCIRGERKSIRVRRRGWGNTRGNRGRKWNRLGGNRRRSSENRRDRGIILTNSGNRGNRGK